MSDADCLFKQIDTNKSGTIDADELLKHLLEAGVDTDEISRTFAAIDADGDGAITKEEPLNLEDNKIGDEGMRHLADALANGAAPTLNELLLHGSFLHRNPASDAAKQAVQDALKNRK